MKPNVNGQDKKAMYANSNRLRIVQRRILFVVAGAWSADFLFRLGRDHLVNAYRELLNNLAEGSVNLVGGGKK